MIGTVEVFRSTKTYGHEVGLSACFRQHKADSHCRLLHGYALAFTFIFEAGELDHRNWVVDFGGLKPLKTEIERYFDHKLLVAADDPYLLTLEGLDKVCKIAEVVVVPKVGCEAFAKLGWHLADAQVRLHGWHPRVSVVSCEVKEHGANSAIYIPPYVDRT